MNIELHVLEVLLVGLHTALYKLSFSLSMTMSVWVSTHINYRLIKLNRGYRFVKKKTILRFSQVNMPLILVSFRNQTNQMIPPIFILKSPILEPILVDLLKLDKYHFIMTTNNVNHFHRSASRGRLFAKGTGTLEEMSLGCLDKSAKNRQCHMLL